MYGNNAYSVYKNNSVNFASKEQLLLMLLDGSVKFAKIARQAIVDKDIKRAHENLVKVQNIYYELITSLDVTKGGEWAQNLMAIYSFIIDKLVEANMKKKVEAIDEIMPLIEEVRETWNEAYKHSKSSR